MITMDQVLLKAPSPMDYQARPTIKRPLGLSWDLKQCRSVLHCVLHYGSEHRIFLSPHGLQRHVTGCLESPPQKVVCSPTPPVTPSPQCTSTPPEYTGDHTFPPPAPHTGMSRASPPCWAPHVLTCIPLSTGHSSSPAGIFCLPWKAKRK